MAPYSLIPPTKPNGEKVDIPEVWLRYTNGNHYDALLKDSHPLITQGTLKERLAPEKVCELKQADTNKCNDCHFTFMLKSKLEEHQQETGHKDGFWQIFPEQENIQTNPISYSQITKGETLSDLVKEVLEFELNSDNKVSETDSELVKERKQHSNTKKALKSLEDEFQKCKAELRHASEETERFKVENKDLKAVINLTNINEKEATTVNSKEVNTPFVCPLVICQWSKK